MRMANRLSRDRTFSANNTSQRHTVAPLRKSNAAILPDSVSESKNALPLQYFKGVGPARAQGLAQRGIKTPSDLLTTFPRDWEDRRIRFSIRQTPVGEKTTLTGAL